MSTVLATYLGYSKWSYYHTVVKFLEDGYSESASSLDYTEVFPQRYTSLTHHRTLATTRAIALLLTCDVMSTFIYFIMHIRHIHPFKDPFSRTAWVSWHQKG